MGRDSTQQAGDAGADGGDMRKFYIRWWYTDKWKQEQFSKNIDILPQYFQSAVTT